MGDDINASALQPLRSQRRLFHFCVVKGEQRLNVIWKQQSSTSLLAAQKRKECLTHLTTFFFFRFHCCCSCVLELGTQVEFNC